MKKVININFQGQVIPIEETAYDMLQDYIISLRNYFANEEGRDEIINDIENRIAELFGESLKKGSACITDADVTRIMNSMGRPEDFDEAEEPSKPKSNGANTQQESAGENASQSNAGSTGSGGSAGSTGKKRLYRDEEDKVIGGVASGLANYLNLDPSVLRIIFALLFIFGGSGLLIYIILWIVLPSRSLVTNVRKRLYRDAEDRVIAGVAGGLAKYFDINPAIPRIVFAAPFILGIVTSVGRNIFNPFPIFVGSFGGGTFVLAYIILWIVLPEAKTAAEKLEMRGEKVDLNTIRDTVVGDLKGVKGRAEKLGTELKASAEKIGTEIKDTVYDRGTQFSNEARSAARRNSSGIGNAIGVLIKAFVYFIVGIVAFALFVALIALLGSGIGVLPLRDFMLQGSAQVFTAWGTILLFLGVPIVALIVWLIRRLMGVRSGNPYLGYMFTFLWLVGLFCFIGLVAMLNRSFSSQVGLQQDIEIVQPNGNKLIIDVARDNVAYYEGWFDFDGVINFGNDSIYLNTAKVNVVRSKDSQYHLHLIKISRGRDRNNAETLAEKIEFSVNQQDSIIYLPAHFAVGKQDKWRNQKVVVVVEVPVGKNIYIDDRVNDYDFFNIHMGGRRNWRADWDREWENGSYYRKGENLLMTPDGLESKSRNNRKKYRYDEDERDEDEQIIELAPPKDTIQINSPVKTDTVYRYNAQAAVQMESTVEVPQHIGMLGGPMSMILRF